MNKKTFKNIYDTYFENVYKSTLAIVRDESLAKDATQETFLTIYKESNQIKNIKYIKSWVITIATRKAIDIVRKESKTFSTDKIDYILKDTKTPYDIVSKKEDKILLDNALKQLGFKYRQIIILRYYFDYSYKEIENILKISEGTVKSRLHKAKKILKDRLKPSQDIEVLL